MFETTNAALWAEDVAEEEGIPVDVTPAPAEADAKCDIALVVRADDVPPLTVALTEEGVPFRIW